MKSNAAADRIMVDAIIDECQKDRDAPENQSDNSQTGANGSARAEITERRRGRNVNARDAVALKAFRSTT